MGMGCKRKSVKCTALCFSAVDFKRVFDSHFRKIGEVKAVFNLEKKIFGILFAEFYVCIDSKRFISTAGRGTVGEHKTVRAEVAAVIFFSRITAVTVIFFAVFIFKKHSVVCPLPNTAADEIWIAVKGFHIVVKVAGTDTHRVRVFAHKEGLSAGLFTLLLKLLIGRIHTADDLKRKIASVLDCALVVCQARFVHFLAGMVHFDKVLSVVRLVTHAPHKDGGVVFIARDKTHDTVDQGVAPQRIFSRGGFFIRMPAPVFLFLPVNKPVRLDIRFVDHVKADLIAQI